MKTPVIILLLIITLPAVAQDTSVKILTQESWPPGKNVPVTIEITKGAASGFARLFYDFPRGFTVENVSSNGADFFNDNMQVNYVWLDLPDQEIMVVRFLARANGSLAGSFKFSGRFDYIADGSNRVSLITESRTIVLDRSAEVETVDLPDRDNIEPIAAGEDSVSNNPGNTGDRDPGVDTARLVNDREIISPQIDFRVQVSISSQRFSQEQLEERIGSNLKHGIRVLKTGSMFKYQSGSFKSYNEAGEYLNELRQNGVDDAFIVAFEDDTQISISRARSLTEL